MKKVAGPLRLNLAQFRDLEAFAEFGSELDAASLAQLERGRRVVEVLKQGQFAPAPVEEQVLSIWAVTNGHMDDVPIEDISRFESELVDFVRTRHGDLLRGIREYGGPAGRGRSRGGGVRHEGVVLDGTRGVAARMACAELRDTRRRIAGPSRRRPEDHPRHGADRRLPHPQGAGPGIGLQALHRQADRGHPNVGKASGRASHMLLEDREVKTVGVLVVSADRGLAGAYASIDHPDGGGGDDRPTVGRGGR